MIDNDILGYFLLCWIASKLWNNFRWFSIFELADCQFFILKFWIRGFSFPSLWLPWSKDVNFKTKTNIGENYAKWISLTQHFKFGWLPKSVAHIILWPKATHAYDIGSIWQLTMVWIACILQNIFCWFSTLKLANCQKISIYAIWGEKLSSWKFVASYVNRCQIA